MQFRHRGLRWIHATGCRIWNRQYLAYPGIARDTRFAAAFPGIVKIIEPQRCSIGAGSVINAGAVIHCEGDVTIGRHVHIGHGCCIYSSNHNYVSDRAIPYDVTVDLRPVTVGDFVWVGAQVCILPGVTVGEGAIIGMGAVVTRDVQAGAIVGGNPAQVIGQRDMDVYFRLKSEGKFC